MKKTIRNRNVALRTITTSGSLDSFTTTYEGQFANQWVSAALLSGVTLDQGLITIKPNVKYKEVIKKLNMDNIVVDGTCDFTYTADAIDLEQRVLEVGNYQVNLQICKSDFESDYLALEQGASAFVDLPGSFADYMLAHVAAKVAEKTEQNIWSGDGATTGQFLGLTPKLDAEANSIKVTLAATSWAATTIISSLGEMVDSVPAAVYGKDDLYIYLGTLAYKAYVRSLGGFQSGGVGGSGTNAQGTQWYANGNGLSFDGINVVMIPGMPATKAVIAEKSNLFFGTSIIDEANGSVVKLLDMSDLDGSNNARVIVRFFAGVEVGVPQDCVIATLG
tara:strand:- start:4589 stop:5590 length:1002 start_codon:yes stop_codon:yes gene_type:complete